MLLSTSIINGCILRNDRLGYRLDHGREHADKNAEYSSITVSREIENQHIVHGVRLAIYEGSSYFYLEVSSFPSNCVHVSDLHISAVALH